MIPKYKEAFMYKEIKFTISFVYNTKVIKGSTVTGFFNMFPNKWRNTFVALVPFI